MGNSVKEMRLSVGHARSFGGARTRLQWCGWGGVLEPWASSDFVGKFWEILELAAKFWESSAGIPGKSVIFASSDGIIRGCTNHDPRKGGI
jgi:hypothetical protein